jgi:hypothetical protein
VVVEEQRRGVIALADDDGWRVSAGSKQSGFRSALLNVTFSERTAKPFSVRRLHAAAVSLPRTGVAGCAS